MKPIQLQIQNNASLERPSWTQYDLEAFKHRHLQKRILRNYYVKTRGKR